MTSENPNTQIEEQDVQLPPDTELVGVYTSVTQANIKDEQKVTTPKALTDGLIAPAEEFEGRVEYQRPWDTEFTEEVGGKYEPFVMPSLSRAHTAFAIPNGDYLWQTTLPSKRKFHDKSELEVWGKENTWTKLEIINSSEKEVEFKAYFTDKFGKENIHHELSTFKKVDKKWYYVSGKFLD
jgi:SEC-C motif-containing protein